MKKPRLTFWQIQFAEDLLSFGSFSTSGFGDQLDCGRFCQGLSSYFAPAIVFQSLIE